MIKNILLDLDNTILDFARAERAAASKALAATGIQPTEEMLQRYHEINDDQWKLFELGRLEREQVKVRRYELLFAEMDIDASPSETARVYEGFLAMGHYFMEGAEELLETLSPEYRLYLATNGTSKVQKSRIKSADISKYFQGIYISEDVGYNKPDVRYFEACFKDIPDFEPAETVMIGDSLTSDMKGGINAGIKTVWFNPEGKMRDESILPDYEIRSLEEIPSLMKKI
ncbi:MAG: YjjG family noncanonical pyrimidine nucleotidase [Clostridia bacterium]|nr:YjjG family noncanonical pyrimidine nucleotidase [Clostridia bacterium]